MNSKPAIWVDGEAATALPLPDRGLDFGDGLFETLLLQHGVPLFKQLHLERLAAGLDALSFPDCLPKVRAQLDACSAQLVSCEWAALRLTVTRGAAPRGYAAPQNANPRIIISAAELKQDRSELPQPIKLGWAKLRWSSQPQLAGIKHLNRLEQVIAANQARDDGWDDVIVLDQQGHVCSLSAGNLFLLESGRLLTPALETCGIAGTRRRLVLEQLGPALGLKTEQTHITPQQLASADAIICCNSIRGLQPVSRLENQSWTDFSVCEALHQHYLEAIAC